MSEVSRKKCHKSERRQSSQPNKNESVDDHHRKSSSKNYATPKVQDECTSHHRHQSHRSRKSNRINENTAQIAKHIQELAQGNARHSDVGWRQNNAITDTNSEQSKFEGNLTVNNSNVFDSLSTGREMTETLAKLTSEFDRMKIAVSDTEKEIEALKKELEDSNAKRETIRDQLKVSMQINADLKANAYEVARMAKTNSHLESRYQELKDERKRATTTENLRSIESLLRTRKVELSQIEQEIVTVDLEIQEIKRDIQAQNVKIDDCRHVQEKEFDKDVQLRLMRNEILNIQGAIRVFVGINKSSFFGGVEVINENTIATTYNKVNKTLHEFDQAFVFTPNWTQEIFTDPRPYITSTMDGYTVGVVAYGGFDSGNILYQHNASNRTNLYELCVGAIFKECTNRSLWKYRIMMSAIEIIGDAILDVGSQNVGIVSMKDNGKSIVLQGLKEHTVDSVEAAINWIRELRKTRADYNQRLQVTASNKVPHFLLMVRIRGKSIIHGSINHGVLTFCDISASVSPEKGEDKDTTIKTLLEVIECIEKGARKVPFRDSPVIHLLKPCLTGDAKCLFILKLEDLRQKNEYTEETLNLGLKIMKMKRKRKKFGNGKSVRIYHTT